MLLRGLGVLLHPRVLPVLGVCSRCEKQCTLRCACCAKLHMLCCAVLHTVCCTDMLCMLC